RLLGALARGDVPIDPDQPLHAPGRAGLRNRARGDPVDRTVGPDDAQFLLERRAFVDRTLHAHVEAHAVVGMARADAKRLGRRPLDGLEPAQPVHLRVPDRDLARQVALPGTDARRFGREQRTLVRLAQLRGRQAKFGDVDGHAVVDGAVVDPFATQPARQPAFAAVGAADAELQ